MSSITSQLTSISSQLRPISSQLTSIASKLPAIPERLSTIRPTRPVLERSAIAAVAVALLGVAALAGGPDPVNAQWVGGPGQGGGLPGAVAAPPAPARTANPGSGGTTATAPPAGKPGTPGRSATSPPAAPPARSPKPTTPSVPAAPTESLDSYLARIPTFPPAPPAEQVTLPPGPHAAWFSRIPTTQKVAFITIDDGWNTQPAALELVKAAKVPVTAFLTTSAIRHDPGYFKRMQANGVVIEAHTMTHTDLKGKSYAFQRNEICGSADQLGAMYGRRPVLFRAPFGDSDDVTLQAVRDCGMKANFFWKETVDKGVMRFQQGNTVQPGDIILMHFRPAFPDDFLATLEAIDAAGLTPALLEDYVP